MTLRRIIWVALVAALAPAGVLAGESADERYDFARGVHARGLHAQGAAEYTSFLKDFPDDRRKSEVLFGLGECLFAQGRHGEAADAYSKIPPRGFGRAAELSMRLGQCRYFQGKHDEASKLIRAALGAGLPKALEPGARYFLARCLIARGRNDEAKQFLGESGSGSAPLLALAESRAAAGDHGEALKICRQLLKGKLPAPVRAEVAFRVAESLRATGRFEEAAAAYSELLKSSPGGQLAAAAKLGLGWTELARGRGDEAVRLARELRASPPAPELSDEARYLEAIAAGRLGRHKEAAGLLGRLASDSPRGFGRRALRARMWELHRAGKAEDTRRAATEFLKAHPEGRGTIEAKYLAAEAELALGSHEKALALFREVAALKEKTPLAPEAAYGAAATLAAMGRHEEAAEAFDDFAGASKGHPLVPEALVAAGREYVRIGKPIRAEGIFLQVVRSGSSAASAKAAARWGMALAAAARNENDEAAKRFGELIAKHPSSPNAPEALLWLGWYRSSKGQLAGAIEAYEKLLKDYAKSEVAGEARYRLGLACQKAGRVDRAAKVFEELREMRPEGLPGEVHLWLSDHWRAKGDLKKAAAALEAVVKFSKDQETTARGLFLLGEVRLERKDLKGASAAFDRLLKELPESPYLDAARLRKGTVARRAGRLDEAEVLLENVIRSAEGLARARAQYELGMVAVAREQTERALRHFLRVIVLYRPADAGEGAEVWALSSLSAARAALALDRREEARRLLKELLAEKHCAQTPVMKEARRMLSDLEMRR